MARILVHEPDPDLRALFAHVLSRLGHEVVLTGDGGVDAALVEPGDAEGRAVLRSLRTAIPPVPVVCVSVYSADEEVGALGPSAYLTKPVTSLALGSALTAALAV